MSHSNTCTFHTLDLDALAIVTGGEDQPAKAPQRQAPGDYSTNGNPLQQGLQMIDNAWGAFQGARKAGASLYQATGNLVIGAGNLPGGYDRNGRPRP